MAGLLATSTQSRAESSGRNVTRYRELRQAMALLGELHKPLAKPRAGDWLDVHEEKRETFDQYRLSRPVVVGRRRRVLYVQPIGQYSPAESNIVDEVASFMAVFYGLPTVVREPLPDSVIPASARRTNDYTNAEQFLSPYILNQVLVPRVPRNGAAVLALTATDLWPGRGWNFVFGQASLKQRVGVWSIARYGNAEGTQAERLEVLRRAVKVAVHETGHMFSLRHCVLHECCMCGSNSLSEADRRPLWFCPHCMAKLCWATGASPVRRYALLAKECERLGLQEEHAFYLESLAALSAGNRPLP